MNKPLKSSLEYLDTILSILAHNKLEFIDKYGIFEKIYDVKLINKEPNPLGFKLTVSSESYTPKNIEEFFAIDDVVANEISELTKALDFLSSEGLIKKESDKYKITYDGILKRGNTYIDTESRKILDRRLKNVFSLFNIFALLVSFLFGASLKDILIFVATLF